MVASSAGDQLIVPWALIEPGCAGVLRLDDAAASATGKASRLRTSSVICSRLPLPCVDSFAVKSCKVAVLFRSKR